MIYAVSDLNGVNLGNGFQYFYDMMHEKYITASLPKAIKGVIDLDHDWFCFVQSTDINFVVDALNEQYGFINIDTDNKIIASDIIMIPLHIFNDVAMLIEKEYNNTNQIDLNKFKHMLSNASRGG